MKKFLLVVGAIFSFIWVSGVCVLFVSLYFSKEEEVHFEEQISEPEYSFRVVSKHFSINVGKATIQDDYRVLSLEDFEIVKNIEDVNNVEFSLGIKHVSFYSFIITLKEFDDSHIYVNYDSCSKLENGEMCQNNSFTEIDELDFEDSLTVDIRYCLKNGRCLTEKTDILFC